MITSVAYRTNETARQFTILFVVVQSTVQHWGR